MTTLEKVDKLRERCDVSYEEAKKALEVNKGDLLEAVIYLEKMSLVKNNSDKGGYYDSRTDSALKEESFAKEQRSNKESRGTFSDLFGKFIRFAGQIINKGNENNLQVIKGEEIVLSLPLTAFALLLIFLFWIIIPILIIGLFLGYRYSFKGPDLGVEKVNVAVEKASSATLKAIDKVVDAAENLVKETKKDKGEKKHGEDTNH